MAVASSTRTMRPLSSCGQADRRGQRHEAQDAVIAGRFGRRDETPRCPCPPGAPCRDASGAAPESSPRRVVVRALRPREPQPAPRRARSPPQPAPARPRPATCHEAVPRHTATARTSTAAVGQPSPCRPRGDWPTPRRGLARSGGVLRGKRPEQLRLDGVRAGWLRRGVGHLLEGGTSAAARGRSGGASGARVEVPAQARLGLDAHAGPAGQVHDVGLVLPATHAHHLARSATPRVRRTGSPRPAGLQRRRPGASAGSRGGRRPGGRRQPGRQHRPGAVQPRAHRTHRASERRRGVPVQTSPAGRTAPRPPGTARAARAPHGAGSRYVRREAGPPADRSARCQLPGARHRPRNRRASAGDPVRAAA